MHNPTYVKYFKTPTLEDTPKDPFPFLVSHPTCKKTKKIYLSFFLAVSFQSDVPNPTYFMQCPSTKLWGMADCWNTFSISLCCYIFFVSYSWHIKLNYSRGWISINQDEKSVFFLVMAHVVKPSYLPTTKLSSPVQFLLVKTAQMTAYRERRQKM